MIAACAAELGVATDVGAAMPGSVDARVVLVTQPSLERSQPSSSRTVSAPPRPQITFGPSILVDFETFVAAYHPWDTMFLADGEAGHALSEAFLSLAERVAGQTILHSQLVTVGGGLSMHVPSSASAPDASNKMGVKEPSGRDPCRRYPTVCLGGTFDHLHLGHKLLLSAAAYLLEVPERKSDDDTASCTLIVGVTGDELLRNKKYAEYVQSWDRRAASVLDFLSTILELNAKGGWRRWTGGMDPADDVKMEKDDNGNTTEMLASFRRGTIVVQCVRIHDAFGPTITQENVDALVVSGETRAGGKAVNDRRAELGWHGLEIYEVDVLGALPDADGADSGDAEGKEGTGPAEHFSDKISSTEIRRLRQMAEKGQG